MNEQAEKLRKYLLQYYPAQEWPTLIAQAEEWSQTRPLQGLKVLDSTPLYRNTLAKFMALIAAGAEVYAPTRTQMPVDTSIRSLLPDFGIKLAEKKDNPFDIILDCSGQFSHLQPTLGYVELTRSGVPRYERAHKPVFIVDFSRIKRLEAVLGTGDGFFRAMKQLGYDDFAGRPLLVVGYGKVGHGITYYARKYGMKVTVADAVDKSGELPGDVAFVNSSDNAALNEAVLHSWCVVTATGKISAMRNKLNLPDLMTSPVLLANMGVEDEYSSDVPAERVLNRKHPINFVLEDPTAMRFIETTMALHNACALDLLIQDLPHKCLSPCRDTEERLLRIAISQGTIGADVELLNSEIL